MDAFEGIAEYLAVAETQGFSAAARKLGVSPAHVSRRISALESRLGVQLVARTTRRVRLTDAGREYHQLCSEMMQRLEETNQLLTGETAELEGRLRVSLHGEFAERHVVPALADFALQNPKLNIEIGFSARAVDFIEDGIDFAIRNASSPDSNLVARKLAERTLVTAASPDYFARYGHPEHPDDLLRHRCLPCESERWHFDTPDGSHEVRVSGQWRSNNMRTILLACHRGVGIAYMTRSGYGSALQDGSLVTTLEPYWARQGFTAWIVYPSRIYLPTRAKRAVEYLLDRARTWKE
jgi:DNA-binding transcriptional LysR family regulator